MSEFHDTHGAVKKKVTNDRRNNGSYSYRQLIDACTRSLISDSKNFFAYVIVVLSLSLARSLLFSGFHFEGDGIAKRPRQRRTKVNNITLLFFSFFTFASE
jgi:hypothetical protein